MTDDRIIETLKQEMDRLKEKQAALEKAIREKDDRLNTARNRWQQTFDAMSEWISIVDDHCRIQRTNKNCEAFLNLEREKVLERYCHDVFAPCLNISPCPLEKALQDRHRVTREAEIPGGKWWEITVDPILNGDTPPTQAVFIVRDITLAKLREIQTIQSKKNAAFRVLAGGIAHDYNNLLAVIMGNLSLAIDGFPRDDERIDFLHEAEKTVRQARDLSHKFLAISGYEYSKKSIGRLNDALRCCVSGLVRDDRVDTRISIDSDLWPVSFDPDQVKILLQNLVINSLEAMPDGGVLKLNARNLKIAHDITSINYFKSNGGGRFVEVVIEDDGIGIPEQVKSRIFDPYFSTKKRGTQKGMGLGLAVVNAILENHGGTVSVASTPGEGTRVTVLFPAYDPDRMVQVDGGTSAGEGRIKIMVMDDEMAMRRLMGNILSSMGHQVALVDNSESALALFKEAISEKKPFDLVILDQIMDGDIDGSDTLEKLKAQDDSIRSVVISGSPHSPTMTNYKSYGFDAALIKPYTRNEVGELIRQLMA